MTKLLLDRNYGIGIRCNYVCISFTLSNSTGLFYTGNNILITRLEAVFEYQPHILADWTTLCCWSDTAWCSRPCTRTPTLAWWEPPVCLPWYPLGWGTLTSFWPSNPCRCSGAQSWVTTFLPGSLPRGLFSCSLSQLSEWLIKCKLYWFTFLKFSDVYWKYLAESVVEFSWELYVNGCDSLYCSLIHVFVWIRMLTLFILKLCDVCWKYFAESVVKFTWELYVNYYEE